MIDTYIPMYSAMSKHRFVASHINTFYKQLSLNPTCWKHINMVSQVMIEFSHLIFGHLIPIVSGAILESNSLYNHDNFKIMISQAWNAITQNCYLPAGARKHNLKIAQKRNKKQLALKAVNMYSFNFELGVHGKCLGFSHVLCDLLRDINEWIGVTMSDTVDSVSIRRLQKDCLSLISRIYKIKPLLEKFENGQTLTLWRNLVFICWWWFDIPSHYLALRFENANKRELFELHSGQNWRNDSILFSAGQRNRLLKNADFFHMGMEIPGEPRRYGSQIRGNMTDDILFDNQMKQVIQQYKLLENEDIWKEHLDNGGILVKLQPAITTLEWTCALNKKNINSNFGLNQRETENKYLDKFFSHMHEFIEYILIDNHDTSIEECVTEFKNKLKGEEACIQVSRIRSAATIYYTYMDSRFNNENVLWMLEQSNHYIHQIESMWQICGLESLKFVNEIDTNKLQNINKVWVSFGFEWETANGETCDLRQYRTANLPSFKPTRNKQVLSLRSTIMPLYVAHDHVTPCKSDYNVMASIFKRTFPKDTQFEDFRGNKHADFDETLEGIEYCGLHYFCTAHKSDLMHECTSSRGGFTESGCCVDRQPYYKVYSIYQGFIPRLFATKALTDLLH